MVAMAQSKANGQGGGLVPAAGGAVAIPTLLGRSAQRIPVGGRIRAGIKVLTRRAAESGQAREIYDAGVAQGKGFDAIERGSVGFFSVSFVIFLVCLAVLWVFQTQTRMGRAICLTGGNKTAAYLCGVPVSRSIVVFTHHTECHKCSI